MRRPIIIDHVGLLVEDLHRSVSFYAAVLAPLGFKVLERNEEACHLGLDDLGDLSLYRGDTATSGVHIAFPAATENAVDKFFAAGRAAGGTERLAPGVRHEYHKDYYAAFLNDPDGNNIEAVHYGPTHPIHKEEHFARRLGGWIRPMFQRVDAKEVP